MKLVRAAAERRVDDRAAGAAELGAEVVGLDLELLHRVRRHLHDLVGEALVAGAVRVVVDAVEDEIVQRAAQAVDVERGVARLADRRLADAGTEQCEVGVGAAVERQVDNRLVADDLAAVARFALEQPGGAGDDNGFTDVADLHRQIDALASVDRHDERLDDRGRKPLQLGPQAVGADANVEELIVPFAVADRRGGDGGVGVLERDGRAGHARAACRQSTVPSTVAASNCADASRGASRHVTSATTATVIVERLF